MIGVILGTSEGKKILSLLNKYTEDIYVTTATTYGGGLLEEYKYKVLNTSPLDENQLAEEIKKHNITILLDASHPYAEIITKNAYNACIKCGIEYVRYERQSVIEKYEYYQKLIKITEYEQIEKVLKDVEGNILNTTGSNNIDKLMNANINNRIIHRILPGEKPLAKTLENGVKTEDIIAIKGPISYDLNCSFIKEYNACGMILKDSGIQGGTEEKIKACIEMDIYAIVVERKPNNFKKVFNSEEKVVEYILNNIQYDKKAILVVSFGTSYINTLKSCIESTENRIRNKFSDYEIRRAFTSKMIIKKIKKRDEIAIDTVGDALEKLKNEGFKEVIVQPLHIMPGEEYENVLQTVNEFKSIGCFNKIVVGRPVLYRTKDYEVAVNALSVQIPKLNINQAVILMGHGTYHPANSSYAMLQYILNENGMENIYVATVEGYPELKNVMPKLKKSGIKEVTLMPFMLVAGDHANNDMAGEEKNSWKNILIDNGFKVNAYLHGLGENIEFQNIYLRHIMDVMDENCQRK